MIVREAVGTHDYEISSAVPEDIPGILTLQDPNIMNRGGALSVHLTADGIERSMRETPIVVAQRDGKSMCGALSCCVMRNTL